MAVRAWTRTASQLKGTFAGAEKMRTVAAAVKKHLARTRERDRMLGKSGVRQRLEANYLAVITRFCSVTELSVQRQTVTHRKEECGLILAARHTALQSITL